MKVNKRFSPAFLACALVALAVLNALAQEPQGAATPIKKFIPPGSKVYVAPMKDGFDTFVIAGIMKKRFQLSWSQAAKRLTTRLPA